jgi:GntR family transcriptional regulator, transcriptional repressor for pyruvate dehydrogenase complex
VTFLWEASMIVEPAIAKRATTDVDAFVRLDRDFHEILANAASNRVLALAHEPVTSLFIPAGRLILPRLKTYWRVLDAHRYIYKCLSDHDPAP